MKTHSTHPTCQTPGYRMPGIDHCLEDPQIRHISFLQERPESFSGEFFEHLFHAAELAGMTLDERNQYDQDMTTEIDKIAQLDYAKEQGMEKGLKQGREEGLLLAAQNLKAEGISAEVICRATGLSQETVHALK